MKIHTHINSWLPKKAGLSNPFLLLIMVAVFSCDTKTTEPVSDYNYFPLEAGRYSIYQVQEEVYSTSQKDPVVKAWQEKDEVIRVETNEGVSTYTFSRSTRNTSADYWQKVKEFTVQKYPDKILTNMDSRMYFSMAFPVDANLEWNGNSYNDLDEENYHYQHIGQPASIDAQSFDKTVTVEERRDTSIINKYIGVKQYALGVGLISDDQTALELCQNENCIGSGKIESGSHKIRKIIEYGSK
ncbi:hypothetical protein [Dyadobacter sediminis]|uniref:Lipoprotein n=1 Tax=Dyadobacter sediminis TaxID=1493691 RepID=A0A5R9K930_9BACT|nr:hypothetical protein [Dyadobacter sediminis]TLU90582.1 hypothetical protein FEM55_18680 [Dyadobacter sediminis]GGC08966.1 hypothetical protein GCM10011325_39880 [Dyadobacter sediminis]